MTPSGRSVNPVDGRTAVRPYPGSVAVRRRRTGRRPGGGRGPADGRTAVRPYGGSVAVPTTPDRSTAPPADDPVGGRTAGRPYGGSVAVPTTPDRSTARQRTGPVGWATRWVGRRRVASLYPAVVVYPLVPFWIPDRSGFPRPLRPHRAAPLPRNSTSPPSEGPVRTDGGLFRLSSFSPLLPVNGEEGGRGEEGCLRRTGIGRWRISRHNHTAGNTMGRPYDGPVAKPTTSDRSTGRRRTGPIGRAHRRASLRRIRRGTTTSDRSTPRRGPGAPTLPPTAPASVPAGRRTAPVPPPGGRGDGCPGARRPGPDPR